MNQEREKLTLAEAVALERLAKTEDLQPLHAPGLGLDQAPPVTPSVGQPVPAGIVIRATPHPEQKLLALKPLERCPTRAEQQAFDPIWADIARSEAAEVEAIAEATRWWLPYPVPRPTASPLPPDILLLSDAAKELGYGSLRRRFAAFLRRYKYPPQYEVISRRALAFLLEKKAAARQESKNNSQKATRAKAVPEPNKGVPKKKQTAAKKF
jgi:hypothetical protein